MLATPDDILEALHEGAQMGEQVEMTIYKIGAEVIAPLPYSDGAIRLGPVFAYARHGDVTRAWRLKPGERQWIGDKVVVTLDGEVAA